jgi:serine/threonine-protein phosphatase 2A regulatory subunit A
VNESVDDEDEILLALAEELGEFVPLVGGPQHAHFLLPPLEALATVDETVVRERAVTSICGVTAQMPAGSVQEHLLPLLQVRWQAGWRCVCWLLGSCRDTCVGFCRQQPCKPCKPCPNCRLLGSAALKGHRTTPNSLYVQPTAMLRSHIC